MEEVTLFEASKKSSHRKEQPTRNPKDERKWARKDDSQFKGPVNTKSSAHWKFR